MIFVLSSLVSTGTGRENKIIINVEKETDLKRCGSSLFKGTILKFTEWEGTKKPWLGQLFCKRSVEWECIRCLEWSLGG